MGDCGPATPAATIPPGRGARLAAAAAAGGRLDLLNLRCHPHHLLGSWFQRRTVAVAEVAATAFLWVSRKPHVQPLDGFRKEVQLLNVAFDFSQLVGDEMPKPSPLLRRIRRVEELLDLRQGKTEGLRALDEPKARHRLLFIEPIACLGSPG